MTRLHRFERGCRKVGFEHYPKDWPRDVPPLLVVRLYKPGVRFSTAPAWTHIVDGDEGR